MPLPFPPAPARRRALAAMLWGGAAMLLPNPPARAAALPRLSGTFIQLLDRHRDWSERDWALLFATLRRLGLSELVVQWAVHDRSRLFGPPPDTPALRLPPLERLLRHAQRNRVRVHLGLVYDPLWWDETARAPERLDPLLDGLLARALAVARELLPLVRSHDTIDGWYLCEEVDPLSWDAPRRPPLFAYLARLSAALRSLTPGAQIALSGFADRAVAPDEVERFWRDLLAAAPAIDRVLFQDGVGVGKLAVNELPDYLAAVARATQAARRNLAVVVETFQQAGGAEGDGAPFAAQPAPLARVAAQMTLAAQHAATLVAFSVPEYMSPLGGPAAAALYRDYLAWQTGRA